MSDPLAKHDRAIKVLSRACERSPAAPENFYNLGKARLARFKDSNDTTDLDQALSLQEQAAKAAQSPPPADKARYLGAAGDVLLARFETNHEKGDLTKAHEFYSKAYKAFPDNPWAVNPDIAPHAANLAKAKALLGDRQSLDEAWNLYQAAYRFQTAARLPAHKQDMQYLISIPEVALQRFKAFGEVGDLSRAVMGSQSVRFQIPEDHPLKPAGLRIFARARLENHKRFGHDLRDAVDGSQQALSKVPADDPDRHTYLVLVGEAKYEQYEQSKDADVLEEACRAFADAVLCASNGTPAKAEYRDRLDSTYVTLISMGRDVDDKTIVSAVEAIDAGEGDGTVEGITESLGRSSMNPGSQGANVVCGLSAVAYISELLIPRPPERAKCYTTTSSKSVILRTHSNHLPIVIIYRRHPALPGRTLKVPYFLLFVSLYTDALPRQPTSQDPLTRRGRRPRSFVTARP
jgi:tetratricopeptide (TPR) repeat protein